MVELANSPIIFKFIPSVGLLQEIIKKTTTYTRLDELDVDLVKKEIEDKKAALAAKKRALTNAPSMVV